MKTEMTDMLAHINMSPNGLKAILTSEFELIWNDRGSGASKDGAFWKPKSTFDTLPIGSMAMSGYGDPDNKYAALCIGPDGRDSKALAHPMKFDLIWADHGSGADRDGSCWRPIPPNGYVSMGDLFMNGYNGPNLDSVWCVRQDLVEPTSIGELIWNDKGSGADKDFAAWEIDGFHGDSRFSCPFIGNNAHERPSVTVFKLKNI
ncbi:MAG: Vps62-related protein [Opitutales bacterium]|nr:Vps62-related protein [Opitutales bacterium]